MEGPVGTPCAAMAPCSIGYEGEKERAVVVELDVRERREGLRQPVATGGHRRSITIWRRWSKEAPFRGRGGVVTLCCHAIGGVV